MRRRPLSVPTLAAGVLLSCYSGGDAPGGSATAGETTTTTTTESPTSAPEETATAPASGTASGASAGGGSTSTQDSDTSGEDASTAKVPLCGDGDVDPMEECDLGPDNDDAGDCTTTCKVPSCGDGHVQPGHGEACDDGYNNSNTAHCTLSCQLAACGDGFVQPGEKCDDGVNDGSYGGCTPKCDERADHCGDGDPQFKHEECDEGPDNGSADGLCNIACRWSGNLVFVSSEAFTGALDGLDGADAKCDALATAAGLVLLESEGFKAWLSDGAASPTTRLKHSDERYILVDGTEVAKDWEDLVDGDLAEAIALTEYGEPYDAVNSQVWTATTVTGKLGDELATCLEWKSEDKKESGGRGSALSVKGLWTESGVLSCGLTARLYCVAQ